MTQFMDLSETESPLASSVAGDGTKAGKFVQLRSPDCEFIVFAPAQMCKYHSDIVLKFAALHDIDVAKNGKGDATGFVDPGWRILGGGKAAINTTRRKLSLGGSSQAFGPFEDRGIAARLGSLKQFEGFSIQVEAL
jgi:hypothetical protein